jgi:transcriptional regulator with XRE-family HTH domain
MALAGRVKQRRLEKGLSQSELARQMGITRTYLYRIEKGEATRPSANVLQRLAQVLDTSVADLLEQPESVEPAAIPPTLRRLAERDNLPSEDVAMLAAIRYRGQQPRSVEGWAHLLSTIRLVTLGPVDES